MNANEQTMNANEQASDERIADESRPGLARDLRETVRRHPRANRIYRTSIGAAGGAATAIGIVLIPLPGPGAVIALGGLALLGTEFEGARTVNAKAVDLVKRGTEQVKRGAEKRKRARAERSAADEPAAGAVAG